VSARNGRSGVPSTADVPWARDVENEEERERDMKSDLAGSRELVDDGADAFRHQIVGRRRRRRRRVAALGGGGHEGHRVVAAPLALAVVVVVVVVGRGGQLLQLLHRSDGDAWTRVRWSESGSTRCVCRCGTRGGGWRR